ncbi:MAG TPA: DNA-3-methyladenine glycosylase [Candidatus Bathyarchaeia archaeon]|nr:DNA-3-methyladenine glycosylase [Candidatus Bathyarchaeia archaeon]
MKSKQTKVRLRDDDSLVRPSILCRSFYERGTITVAKELLGKFVVRVVGRNRLVGRIVEVEAYRGFDDPASHAFHGITPRAAPMFGEPGHAYVYFTYGNHYCFNVTTERTGVAGAVLIRALEPVEGVNVMKRFRPHVSTLDITNGPGKLTKALCIDKSLNKIDLTKRGPLFLRGNNSERVEIVCSIRIGITAGTDRLWRFFVNGNPYVSRFNRRLSRT